MLDRLSTSDTESIQVSLGQKVESFFPEGLVSLRLERLWGDAEIKPTPPTPDEVITQAYINESRIEFRTSEPPSWVFGFTPEFEKSTKNVDNKLKGRILDAIQSLTNNPTDLKGDTVKPLVDKYAGLWRYRIGDYRLIYRPDNMTRRITLLTFLPRGSAYKT
jgi:mRNA-degrading endonuclease RelE of RelBE toxin-antitoxin system